MIKAIKILSSEYGDCDIENLEQDNENKDNENNIDYNMYFESDENEEKNNVCETDNDNLNILEEIENEDLNSNSQNNIITGKRLK